MLGGIIAEKHEQSSSNDQSSDLNDVEQDQFTEHEGTLRTQQSLDSARPMEMAMPADDYKKLVRRVKNRESARRVRARRVQELSVMQLQVAELTKQKNDLHDKTTKLENQKQYAHSQLLETQLKYKELQVQNMLLKRAVDEYKLELFALDGKLRISNSARAAEMDCANFSDRTHYFESGRGDWQIASSYSRQSFQGTQSEDCQ